MRPRAPGLLPILVFALLLSAADAASATAGAKPRDALRRIARVAGANDGGPDGVRLRYAVRDAKTSSASFGESSSRANFSTRSGGTLEGSFSLAMSHPLALAHVRLERAQPLAHAKDGEAHLPRHLLEGHAVDEMKHRDGADRLALLAEDAVEQLLRPAAALDVVGAGDAQEDLVAGSFRAPSPRGGARRDSA